MGCVGSVEWVVWGAWTDSGAIVAKNGQAGLSKK